MLEFPSAFRHLFATTADDGRPVRYRATYGGRGSAKSHSKGAALLVKARAQPLRILCAREIQRSIRDSVKRLLDDKIEALGFGEKGENFFQTTDNEIRGNNGSLFSFIGLRSNINNVRSLEGYDIAYLSEARSVSQASLNVLIPTIRNPNSEIWFDWNPVAADDPVDKMFRGKDGPPPGSIVREVNYDQNPWFPDVLRDDMEFDRRRDPEKYSHIWAGGYQKNSEARVFKNYTVEAFETPADAEFLFGGDWGFSIDPTVLVRAFISGRTLYIDQEAYAVGCEIDDTPALFAGNDTEAPARWLNRKNRPGIPGAAKWQIIADSARPETISYMQKRGFRIKPAIKGAGSIEEGIEFLKSFDIVVHPRCRHAIDELALYSFKTDPLTGDVLPILEDKKNHVIDALRYACESQRRARSKGFQWVVGNRVISAPA